MSETTQRGLWEGRRGWKGGMMGDYTLTELVGEAQRREADSRSQQAFLSPATVLAARVGWEGG